MKKVFTTVCLSAAMMLGCQSNSGTKSATADATKASHEPEVCETPGQGAPTKAVAKSGPVAVYGGEMKISDADAIVASKVIADPAAYTSKDKPVRVTGVVSSVCEKKGCWLRIVPDDATAKAAGNDIFIKFQDPPAGRLIPMEAVGKKATVEGTLVVGMMSEAQARHFKEDSGASEEELAKIVGPQKQLVIRHPVVAIEGVEKAN